MNKDQIRIMHKEQIRKLVIAKNHGWHSGEDHLGPRLVFLNGKLIENVIRANERKGIVVTCGKRARLDKHKKRLLVRTMRGEVRVEFVWGGSWA